MSNSDVYNVVAAVGIVLCLGFTYWVKGKTRQVQEQARQLRESRQRSKRGHGVD